MSDPILHFSWGETARRLAVEFDARLGSPAAEIVTFEATRRAIAVGVAMPGACARLPIGRLLEGGGAGRSPRVLERRAGDDFVACGRERSCRELARIDRVIVLGFTRCVNRVYVLQGAGDKMYAVHGLGAESVEAELVADMDAIASRLVEGL
jgi:hypothetical protein